MDIAETAIPVQDAPAIEGLTFRHFRGDEDFPAILAVNHASKVADKLDHDLHTLETIKHAYSATPYHDPRTDMILAEVNGELVGFSRVFWAPQLDGTRVYWHFGFVVPEWRGQGLGRAMIRWAEGRACEMEAGRGDKAPVYVGTEAYSTQEGIENLLKMEGYEPVRYSFHMETPDLDHIPDAPMPEGLEVRPAKPEHYRAIYEASVEAFRDHWGASESYEDYDRWISNPMNEPELWMVAWDGDQVAGSILNYINYRYNAQTGRKLGYTEAISVRRPWRRKGLARALLARSMQMHKERGMTQTGLGVDTENPSGALKLYESMGYQV
ncbi:MAG: GNAT family N-acetyltransferase, partial [Chloroflexota bacterium]|nr:GNAT family N-acetyltransferase [Chloroflexota bacterium]